MDARGYGRRGRGAASGRDGSRPVLVLGGLMGVVVGLYGLLDAGSPGSLGLPLVVVGGLARRRRLPARPGAAASARATARTRGAGPSG